MEISTNRKIQLTSGEISVLNHASDIISDMIEDMDETFDVYAVLGTGGKEGLGDVGFFFDVSNALYNIANAENIEVGD